MSNDSEWEYWSVIRKILQSGLSHKEKRNLIGLARCVDGSLENARLIKNHGK